MADLPKLLKLLGKGAEEVVPAAEQIAKKSGLKYPGGLTREEYMALQLKNKINARRAASGNTEAITEQMLKKTPPDASSAPIAPMAEEGPVTLAGTNKTHDPDLSGLINYKKSAKGMMPLGAAAQGLYEDLQASPLGDMATKWEKLKKMVSDPLAKQLDLSGGKDKQFQEQASGVLSTVADPINFIPGVGGVAAGATEMLARDPEEEKKKEEKNGKLSSLP